MLALRPFGAGFSRLGLMPHRNGGIFFEHYPCTPGPLVLNGHLQVLLGLYDWAKVSPKAARLFRLGRRTAIAMLPAYDHQPVRYDLSDRLTGKVVARSDYQALVRGVLVSLDEVSRTPAFELWARRWDSRTADG